MIANSDKDVDRVVPPVVFGGRSNREIVAAQPAIHIAKLERQPVGNHRHYEETEQRQNGNEDRRSHVCEVSIFGGRRLRRINQEIRPARECVRQQPVKSPVDLTTLPVAPHESAVHDDLASTDPAHE